MTQFNFATRTPLRLRCESLKDIDYLLVVLTLVRCAYHPNLICSLNFKNNELYLQSNDKDRVIQILNMYS